MKNIYKISVAIGLFLVVLLNLVSATIQTLPNTIKQNECVNLPQAYANSEYQNITIVQYPNGSYISINKEMTKDGSYFNYTFCHTSSIGKYIVNGIGDMDGVLTSWAYDFEVTSNGEKVSLSNIVLVLAFLIVAIIMFVIGNSFENDKYIVKTSFYIFALLMGLLAISSAGIIASESESLSTMSTMGLLLILSVISFIFLYVFIKWSIYTFEQFKTKKEERWN